MWRRTYLFLVLVRLWFALSPSYLHPDENFQGPEVIAGMLDLPTLPSFSLRFCALGRRSGPRGCSWGFVCKGTQMDPQGFSALAKR